ncbi:MAG: hypothetical protein GVY13_02660 [Alphaproteobacteria bacterium]|jgi:hypothetical protein|nr:hypothetical protein [Alphaproteobacteria bacterium]
MSPRLRIVFTLAVSTMAALVLSALLVFGALDRLRVRAAEANIDFVLTQLRTALESSVSLGLPLSEIPVAQDLIERAKAGNPEILAVEVFLPNGVSVFNTDRGSLGEPITEAWREARRRAAGRWRVEEFGSLIVGDDIRNDFGATVGGIAVTVSGAARAAHAETLIAALVPWTALVAGTGLLLAGAAAALLLGHAGLDFRRAAALLSGAPNAEPGTPQSADGLAGRAAAMRRHVRDRAAGILALAGTVRALDEEEPDDIAASGDTGPEAPAGSAASSDGPGERHAA